MTSPVSKAAARRSVSVAAMLLCLGASGVGSRPALAAETAEATLTTLYRLALSAEMCGFAVTEAEANAIGARMNKAITELKLPDDSADAFSEKVEAAMAAEGWDKLCAKTGAWAKTYQDLLKTYGK